MIGLFEIVTLAAAVTSASPTRHVERQQICNGNAAFCDRRYSNVSLIGTHNAPFVGSFLDPRMNQEKTVTEQLDAGVRFLQAQTHMGNPSVLQLKDDDGTEKKMETRDDADELSMCHTSCELLYAGSLKDYLSTVKTWLDSHPNDVVTMLLTNPDLRPMSEFDSVFKSTGLDSLAYIPPTSPSQLPMNQWPAYRDLISQNKRLIVFMDSMTDETKVPYILSEFTYFFETPYGNKDPKFAQCDLDRPKGQSAEGRMYIVNHTLNTEFFGATIPDNEENFKTNAATGEGSIGAQADLCTKKWSRKPNVVLVDMFDRGDVFTAQKNLNGP
ncbi:PI-PLC X domain-containing protein 1 [Pseudocercospora fuligena]|uniref:PI-PLC X domain-containing protein 1 n=1 Tax=Pseudocercospora fuligena TaxID=685502 RepID=A0A8H6VMA6_9PEZI|nr:PI-PLC X domain-containing protein 1 [Pseudocercospora fuligena]